MFLYFTGIMIKAAQFNSYINKTSYSAFPLQISGINPKIRYEYSDKYFNLPRFISKEMREAREMNKLVLKDIKYPDKFNIFKNALQEDLVRLTDKSSEASFQRVRWVNPKDGKAYYLLNNGKTDDGRQIVRILDSDGAFIKEAAINKKKIIVFECMSDEHYLNTDNITHADLMKLFVKRYNPFADIKLYYWKDDLKISKEMLQELDKDTAAISCAFCCNARIIPSNRIRQWFNNIFNKRTKISEPEKLSIELANDAIKKGEDLVGIPPHIRIFMSSSNAGKNAYNKYLSLKNVEGVGSLDYHGKIAEYSSSRSSYFTQHYEAGEFGVMQYKEGFTITGTNDIDIPVKSNECKLLKPLAGTSFSVSIRTAKVVLNEMMEGLL